MFVGVAVNTGRMARWLKLDSDTPTAMMMIAAPPMKAHFTQPGVCMRPPRRAAVLPGIADSDSS